MRSICSARLPPRVCFYGMWLLARDTLGEFEGLIAVLALEGIHFYNFSVVKFAHDQMQLPFWAFAGLLFWRAVVHGRKLDWILAGILWLERSGRNTPPSRLPRRSGLFCCSIRMRGGPGLRPGPI